MSSSTIQVIVAATGFSKKAFHVKYLGCNLFFWEEKSRILQ